MKSKNNISKLLGALFIIFALTFSIDSYATDSFEGNGNSNGKSKGNSNGNSNGYSNGYSNGNSNSDSSDGGDSIPLDGGLSILLFGAAAFGVKKLRDTKK